MSEEEQEIPEVTPQELSEWLKTRPELILLDVREPYEFPRASLKDERVVKAPLSDLARKSFEALPETVRSQKDKPLVVICHHGNRSALVTAWLLNEGWQSVHNLAGGIDAYARKVDPEVGLY